MSRSVKAQFKYADKTGCRYVVILGEDEMAQGMVKLRNMVKNEESMLPIDGVVDALSAMK
jgi:histidyl-tRNA synthetase